MKRRLLHLFIALDQLMYVILTAGRGYPDETLSAAAWRLEQQGKLAGRVFRPVIDFLLQWLEKDHCRLSFESELAGNHLDPAYRRKP